MNSVYGNSENVKIFLSSKQNRLEQLFSIQYNDDRFQITANFGNNSFSNS